MSEFVVRPFAFMRLTHEALRSGYAAVGTHARAGDLDAAADAWKALSSVMDLHKRQEEEVFFPLLDAKFDGAVRNGGLREAHVREEQYEKAVVAAFAAGDASALAAAVDAWADSFEQHLKDEEDLMMPLTQKVAPTAEGRAAAVGDIMAVDWDTLRDVQLPYVSAQLAQTKPYGPVRMFVAAVQAASGERYAELEPAIRAALPAQLVANLENHGHLSA